MIGRSRKNNHLNIKLPIISALLFGAVFFSFSSSSLNLTPVREVQAVGLSGRILLQVQDKGQAWYVNPLDSRRYYLGRPDDAFAAMRRFGLGITNTDFARFSTSQAPVHLAGRIVLKVQDKGQAYYINPLDRKLTYLGRPVDAFAAMRRFGLGISNTDLDKITLGEGEAIKGTTDSQTGKKFNFKYQNSPYYLNLDLSVSLYQAYQAAPHVFSYIVGQEPPDTRESFYGLFFQTQTGDDSLDRLISRARTIVANKGWSDDQMAEFILALVQYIPYDQAKLAPGANAPFYPYETLYLNRGICADKTFLAVALLRRLGYGAAVLDFPDINHSAAGVACPLEYSLNNSGYCFIETTNYFPWSVIPEDINGQAQAAGERFDNLFNPAGLGKIEIKQATTGKSYQGAAAVHGRVADLQARQTSINSQQAIISEISAAISQEEQEINSLKSQLDAYLANGQAGQYNALIPEYNNQVNQYNATLADYQLKIATYNQTISEFNQLQKEFYQFE